MLSQKAGSDDDGRSTAARSSDNGGRSARGSVRVPGRGSENSREDGASSKGSSVGNRSVSIPPKIRGSKGTIIVEDDDDDETTKGKNLGRDPSSPLLGMAKARKPPAKRANRQPVQYYRTASNKLRRVYRNRCERYCLGPISIAVDAIGLIVLTIVNLIQLGLGVACMYVGLSIDRKQGTYDEIVAKIKTEFDSSMSSLGLAHAGDDIKFERYLKYAAFPLLVLGFIVSALALCGIIGPWFKSIYFLTVYARTCAFLLLLEFCGFLFIYDGEPDLLKLQMYDSLDVYSGVEGSDTITRVWNLLMGYLHCCGVDSYMDFEDRRFWPPQIINMQTYDLLTPVFCCKNKTTDFSCAIRGTANPSNNNMNRGCYIPLYDLVFRNKGTLFVVYMAMTCQAVVLFFSSWMSYTADLNAEPAPPSPRA